MFKRGLSHIEFVISFIIFIGFLVFAFVFFNPLQSNRTIESTLDYAWLEVSEEARDVAETYSVSIDPAQVALSLVSLEIPGISPEYNASVEDIDGNVVPSYSRRSDGNVRVTFDRNNTLTSNKYFFRIRYSPSLYAGAPIAGSPILLSNDDQYYISSSEKNEFYFESLFTKLKDDYDSNYTLLKQRFNLPNRMEFGFMLKLNNGTEISAINEIPENYEVLSKTDRVQLILSSGKIEYGDVFVFVW